MCPVRGLFPARCGLRSGCRPSASAAQRHTRSSVGAISPAQSCGSAPNSTTINFGTKTHQKPYNIGFILTGRKSNDANCSRTTMSKRIAIDDNFLTFGRDVRSIVMLPSGNCGRSELLPGNSRPKGTAAMLADRDDPGPAILIVHPAYHSGRTWHVPSTWGHVL